MIQLQNFVNLTTSGTSGASTLTNGTLNVPDYATGNNNVNLFLTTGDQSTTSTLAVNITDLVCSLQSNKRYFLNGQLRVGSSGTSGLKYAASIPTGSTMNLQLFGQAGGGTAFNSLALISSGILYGPINTNSSTTVNFIRIKGEISTGLNLGNLQLIFASGLNTQTVTIYQLGTFLQLTQLN